MQFQFRLKRFHAVKKDVQFYLSKFSSILEKCKKFIRSKAFGKLPTCIELNKGIYKVYLSVHSKTLIKVEIYLQALVAKGWGH